MSGDCATPPKGFGVIRGDNVGCFVSSSPGERERKGRRDILAEMWDFCCSVFVVVAAAVVLLVFVC